MNIEMRDIKRMLDDLPGHPQNMVSINMLNGDVIIKTDAGLSYRMTDDGLEKVRPSNPDDYETPWTAETLAAGEEAERERVK